MLKSALLGILFVSVVRANEGAEPPVENAPAATSSSLPAKLKRFGSIYHDRLYGPGDKLPTHEKP